MITAGFCPDYARFKLIGVLAAERPRITTLQLPASLVPLGGASGELRQVKQVQLVGLPGAVRSSAASTASVCAARRVIDRSTKRGGARHGTRYPCARRNSGQTKIVVSDSRALPRSPRPVPFWWGCASPRGSPATRPTLSYVSTSH